MHRLYKGKYFLVAVAFVSAIALGSVAAHAQLVGEIEANIPFAFSAENARLPAGQYYVRSAKEIGGTVLEIESLSKHIAVFVNADDLKSNSMPKTSELVFEKIGDRYFLREIIVEGSQLGYSLAQSKAESNLLKGNAKMEKQRVAVKHHAARVSKP